MKILYIHHANILSGATLSLMYLVREVEKESGLVVFVASHAANIRDLYSRNFKSSIIPCPSLCTHLGKFLIGWIGWQAFWRVPQSRKFFLKDLLGFPISVWKQLKCLRNCEPDLVHLNSATMFSSAIAARLAGIPVVWHIREPLQGPVFQIRIIGYIIRTLAKAVITISEEEAVRLGEDREKKVHVIYNPINVDTLIPEHYEQVEEKKKLGFVPTDRVVLSLGGVNPRKGTLELVEAMQYVDQHTYLLIAGPPLIPDHVTESYESKIESVLANLPANKVAFTGNLENIVPLLAACDILVFAGTKPHFPRPVYEAWQMRKPVMVFEMKGVSNQITHGVNGIIVKKLSGQSLGLALADLLKKNVAMKHMGENGRLKAEEKCNPASVAEQVLSVYHEILGS